MNAAGRKVSIKYLDARNEVIDAYADHSKVSKFFGTGAESVSLNEGLSRMMNWVNRIGPRQSVSFPNVELTDRLPPSWKTALSK